jgi:hypothetical protein
LKKVGDNEENEQETGNKAAGEKKYEKKKS